MAMPQSIKFFARKGFRMILIGFGAILVCGLILIGVLLASSAGKPEPFLDEAGNQLAASISEKIFIDINGVQQGMFIKGKDAANPVLLYLHGGTPDYFLTKKYPTGLEEYFTVVWWEQRGSGLSYSASTPPETLNVDQFIADTLTLTNYLRDRFDQDKIYLMGHSGGSFIGIQAAAKAPELYHAYLGVAQMSCQLESETIAYEYMLQQFRNNGNKMMQQKLEVAPVTLEDGISDGYPAVRDTAMHSLGVGTTRDMKSVVSGIFFPSLVFREYTLMEKVKLWRAKSQTGISSMWDEMTATDLRKQVTELDIPVYFFSGIYDYTVSYTLAKEYFEDIQAPVKGFYTFDQSAHSPFFEEPEKMLQIIREDVLPGTNSLADKK